MKSDLIFYSFVTVALDQEFFLGHLWVKKDLNLNSRTMWAARISFACFVKLILKVGDYHFYMWICVYGGIFFLCTKYMTCIFSSSQNTWQENTHTPSPLAEEVLCITFHSCCWLTYFCMIWMFSKKTRFIRCYGQIMQQSFCLTHLHRDTDTS